MRNEFLFAGFGGQGIIKAALLLAEAAGIYDNKEVIQTQSYGPEARGGACRSEVVVDDEPIAYIKTQDIDVMVAMSQFAFNSYKTSIRDHTKVIVDEDLVKDIPEEIPYFPIPATRIAQDEFGRSLFANIIMLGAMSAVTGLVPLDALSKSLDGNVPPKTLETNRMALSRGFELGSALLKK